MVCESDTRCEGRPGPVLMVTCSKCQCVNDDAAKLCRQCHSNLAVTGIPTNPAELGRKTLLQDRPDDPLPPTVRLARVPLVEPTDPAEGAAPPAKQGRPGDAAEQTTVVLPVPPPAPMVEPVEPLPDAPAPRPVAPAGDWPPDARPRLVVVRGLRVDHEFPLSEGRNLIGRPDDKPVDVNLEDQEPVDRVWASRQHAVITFENGRLFIEDLNSLNGTFVNRTRVHPNQQRPLQVGDVIQIGTVQMRVTA